jgi:hypothetical protein
MVDEIPIDLILRPAGARALAALVYLTTRLRHLLGRRQGRCAAQLIDHVGVRRMDHGQLRLAGRADRAWSVLRGSPRIADVWVVRHLRLQPTQRWCC